MCEKSLCPQLATFGNFQNFLLATTLKIGQKLAIYSVQYIFLPKKRFLVEQLRLRQQQVCIFLQEL